MQVNRDCSQLRQFQMQVCDWVAVKLREQQRFELPILFESGEAKPSNLKVFPSSMKLFNSLLQDLRRNFTKSRKFLFGFGQVIKLADFSRKLQVCWQDIFRVQRTSIYRTLARVTPVFNFSQSIVKGTATNLHPLNELLLLSGIWIQSVAIVYCQHPLIVEHLLALKANIKC